MSETTGRNRGGKRGGTSLPDFRVRAFRFLALQNQADVTIHDFTGRTIGRDMTIDQQRGLVAETLHQAQVMRYEKDRDPSRLQVFELANAAVGKDRVADRECLV